MKKIKYSLATIGLLILTIVSCTKDTENENDNSSSEASVQIEAINELDIQTGNEISNDDNNASSRIAKTAIVSCPSITLETQTTTFPKTYIVDYGTACVKNNILRKGQLRITFTGYVTEAGSEMTIERDNYYVNGNKLEGTVVYENETTNSAIPTWSRTVTDGKFTTKKGKVFLSSGTHKVRQTAGVSTPLVLTDNTFEMFEGTHSITNENGGITNYTVVESLIKNYTCDYVSQGQLRVENSFLNGIVDYGNGDCDNDAIYTQNGVAYPFKM